MRDTNAWSIRRPALRVGGIAATLLAAMPALCGPLSVSVTHARSDAGSIRCGLFDRSDTWRQEDRAMRAVAAPIHNATAHCDFGEVPEGDYAVAVFHAEHGETQIEYGFLGKPKQGVGFSNNPSIAFGAPDFEAARIRIGREPVNLEITVKY